MTPDDQTTAFLRKLAETSQMVRVENFSKERATLIRVYWPNGAHTDHKVFPREAPTQKDPHHER